MAFTCATRRAFGPLLLVAPLLALAFVERSVRGAREHSQILNPVVRGILVYVVHVLVRIKDAAEVLFHEDASARTIAAARIDLDAPIGTHLPTLEATARRGYPIRMGPHLGHPRRLVDHMHVPAAGATRLTDSPPHVHIVAGAPRYV